MTKRARARFQPAAAGWLLAAVALAAPLASQAAGDAKAGGDVFAAQCAECHSMKEGKNKKGPSLFAVVGRKAGTIPDFKYSEPMKAAGYAWTPELLDAYIALPKKAVPGGIMKFDGLPEAPARADLIEYLSRAK